MLNQLSKYSTSTHALTLLPLANADPPQANEANEQSISGPSFSMLKDSHSTQRAESGQSTLVFETSKASAKHRMTQDAEKSEPGSAHSAWVIKYLGRNAKDVI